MNGKEKCNELKKIRKNLADKLNIDLHQTECKYEGECKGTCPKCQSEEKILNTALLKKGAVVLGATTLSIGLAACGPLSYPPDIAGLIDEPQDPPVVEKPLPDDLSGEVAPIDEPQDPPVIDEPTQLEGDVAIQEEV